MAVQFLQGNISVTDIRVQVSHELVDVGGGPHPLDQRSPAPCVFLLRLRDHVRKDMVYVRSGRQEVDLPLACHDQFTRGAMVTSEGDGLME